VCPMEGKKPSQPMHCSKAVYCSGFHDKTHNCRLWDIYNHNNIHVFMPPWVITSDEFLGRRTLQSSMLPPLDLDLCISNSSIVKVLGCCTVKQPAHVEQK